jgi:hypothetical protein
MAGARTSQTISTRLQRIAEQARMAPDMALTNLAHHVDVALLAEAHKRTPGPQATEGEPCQTGT